MALSLPSREGFVYTTSSSISPSFSPSITAQLSAPGISHSLLADITKREYLYSNLGERQRSIVGIVVGGITHKRRKEKREDIGIGWDQITRIKQHLLKINDKYRRTVWTKIVTKPWRQIFNSHSKIADLLFCKTNVHILCHQQHIAIMLITVCLFHFLYSCHVDLHTWIKK